MHIRPALSARRVLAIAGVLMLIPVSAAGSPATDAQAGGPEDWFETAVVDLSALPATETSTSTTTTTTVPADPLAGAEPVSPDCGVCAGWTRVVDLPIEGEQFILSWSGADEVVFELRSRGPQGWSEWSDASASLDEAPDPGVEGPDDDTLAAGPIWTGRGTDAVELVIETGEPENLQLEVLRANRQPDIASAPAALPPTGTPGMPAMISRAAWGAGPWVYGNQDCGDGPSYADRLQLGVVHHTVTTNDYAPSESDDIVRAIYYMHAGTNGWCDIGYNFLVDKYGQVFEGRTDSVNGPVRGGHARGFNTGSVGVALLGQYQPGASPTSSTPTSPQLSKLQDVLAWQFRTYQVDPSATTVFPVSSDGTRYNAGDQVTLPTIVGHRDVSATGCPGDNAYVYLPTIRSGVTSRLRADVYPDGVGIRRGSEYFLRNRAGPGLADMTHGYGLASDTTLVGDFNANNFDTIAIYRDRTFYIRNANAGGPADLTVTYGAVGDSPVVADWDGDGSTTIGVRRDNVILARNSNTGGPAQLEFSYGWPTDVVVTGDWNGDGVETIGVRRGNQWLLRNSNSAGVANLAFSFGKSTDVPVVGDWNGDGVDTIGVVRGKDWFLRNTNAQGDPDLQFGYGAPADVPVPGGDWMWWTPDPNPGH